MTEAQRSALRRLERKHRKVTKSSRRDGRGGKKDVHVQWFEEEFGERRTIHGRITPEGRVIRVPS
jgi:hypothetical protein